MKLNIFSYVTGYDTKIYERFAGSLFDTGFDGKLFLFVNKKDLTTLSKLDKSLLEKISIVKCPEYMIQSRHLSEDNDIKYRIHPQNFRYLLYLGFLQQYKQPRYEYSFFCDARDLLFQKNPNEYHIDNDIDMLIFQEDIVIKECIYNTAFMQHVKDQIPDGIYDYINKKAICSGTILVKNEALNKFIVKFCEYMVDNNLDNSSIITDQGLHTYLVYNNLYDCNYKIITNEENFVKTIAMMDHSQLQIIDNQIADKNGVVPYIVHQYDRLDRDTIQKLSCKSKYDLT